jgi:3-hydroxybutyrate dehydrogenase
MDKVAIITGAASGIGKEIAAVFVQEGAKVAIADLDLKAAGAAAREIDPEGKRALGVRMDVSDEEQVERGTAAVVEAFGRLDILISNAGVQIVAPVVDFEFAKWKKMLAIHLDGAFLTTRAALRQIIGRTPARSSTWARCTRRKPRNSRRPTSRPSTGSLAWRKWSPRRARPMASAPT